MEQTPRLSTVFLNFGLVSDKSDDRNGILTTA